MTQATLAAVSVAIGITLPMLTGLVTNRMASGTVKSITLLALSAAGGTLLAWQASPNEFTVGGVGLLWATQFVTAVSTHFGALKQLGVTGADGIIQRKVPQGIGGPTQGTTG